MVLPRQKLVRGPAQLQSDGLTKTKLSVKREPIISPLRYAFIAAPRLSRANNHSGEPMRLIIGGVPCCGKTRFGDWLRDHHGFAHADLEPRRIASGPILPPQIHPELVPWLASLTSRIVVTWGFDPSAESFEVLRLFRDRGFIAWWFEGDFEIARRQYVKRDGEKAAREFFDGQRRLLKGAALQIDKFYGPNRLTTLTKSGLLNFPAIYDHIRQARERFVSRPAPAIETAQP